MMLRANIPFVDYKINSQPFRICHILASHRASLKETLEKISEFKFVDVDALLELGAIYLNHQRIRQNDLIEPNNYIRVHMDPRRFSIGENLSRNIVFENNHFLIFDKPAGVPVHATVDNWVENVIYQIEKENQTRLLVTHRIDIATSGLVLYAKTKEFQSAFNKLIRENKVQKFYTALTEKSLPLGDLVHYMQPSPRAPKTVQRDFREDFDRCLLSVQKSFCYGDGYASNIQLHTGRTHQIRAQLADVGTPIVGDTMYGGSTHFEGFSEENKIGLICSGLDFIEPIERKLVSFQKEKIFTLDFCSEYKRRVLDPPNNYIMSL